MESLSKIIQNWCQSFYKGPPLDFWFYWSTQNSKGDPYEMTNINFVQSCSNFSQPSKIKKQASSQNLKSVTIKIQESVQLFALQKVWKIFLLVQTTLVMGGFWTIQKITYFCITVLHYTVIFSQIICSIKEKQFYVNRFVILISWSWQHHDNIQIDHTTFRWWRKSHQILWNMNKDILIIA